MKIHELTPPEGARTARKRVGRGIGGKGGKTAGRGTKGQKSRGAGKVRVGFEGGQVPLYRRTPKLPGFNNPFRVEYQAVNLDTISESGLSEVNPETLLELGLVGKNSLVKILGRGTLKNKVTVKAHAISKSARKAIEDAGGTVEEIPLPFAVRPAAKGNALTNR